MRKEQGFTLIELVAVIVILGILAATAIPKFVSLQEEAYDAVNQGTAGAIASAGAINYAKYLTRDTGDTDSFAIDRCAGGNAQSLATNINELMAEDTTDWAIEAVGANTATPSGESFQCTVVVNDEGAPAVFTFISTDD